MAFNLDLRFKTRDIDRFVSALSAEERMVDVLQIFELEYVFLVFSGSISCVVPDEFPAFLLNRRSVLFVDSCLRLG